MRGKGTAKEKQAKRIGQLEREVNVLKKKVVADSGAAEKLQDAQAKTTNSAALFKAAVKDKLTAMGERDDAMAEKVATRLKVYS